MAVAPFRARIRARSIARPATWRVTWPRMWSRPGSRNKCEIQVAYAIGGRRAGIDVDRHFRHRGRARQEAGSSDCASCSISVPPAIIRTLDLKRPIYQATAAYGHFGRTPHNGLFPWEEDQYGRKRLQSALWRSTARWINCQQPDEFQALLKLQSGVIASRLALKSRLPGRFRFASARRKLRCRRSRPAPRVARPQSEWADQQMPVLRHIRERFAKELAAQGPRMSGLPAYHARDRQTCCAR